MDESFAPPPHDPAPVGRDDPTQEGPRPLGVPIVPTGLPGVDGLLERLSDADHLGVPGHLEVYEDVHRGLRDTLTALDQQPGPLPPSGSHDPRS